MIGQNSNAQKPLLTKTSLEYNDADCCSQLWQESDNLRLPNPNAKFGTSFTVAVCTDDWQLERNSYTAQFGRR